MTESFNAYLTKNLEVASQLEHSDLQAFLDGLRRIRDSESTLWIAGNGGSAATASHASVDFVKTSTQFQSKTLKTIALSELISLQTALANDLSFEQGFGFSLRSLAKRGDGLLILSVSGTSPNLMHGAEVAKALGLPVFAITGSKGKKLCEVADFALCLPSENYQIVENIHMLLVHWFTVELGQG